MLRDPDCLPGVAADIALNSTNAAPVIAVVSAFLRRTDELILEARRNGLHEESADYAKHVSTGEVECGADLLQTLKSWDVDAAMATPRRIGFTAEGSRLDAAPKLLDRNAVAEILKSSPVLIVPGYAAVDQAGDPVLLGRGGSDLTAVHLAARLECESVRLVKDVDAVYDRDPSRHESARRQLRLDYDAALKVAGKLIQPKSLLYAKQWNVRIEISALGEAPGTVIAA